MVDLLRGASPEAAAHLAAGRAALARLPYRDIWVADTEFRAVGDPQRPWCLSAVELRTGREVNLWLDGYRGPCPLPTGRESLFVAFVAGAEVGTFLAMGWAVPARILDLFAEYRVLTNTGLPSDARKLTLACERAGLPFVEAAAKDANREEAITRTAWPEEERRRLLAYCREDTLATARLFLWLWPRWLSIHAGKEEAALAYTLHRGRYAAEMARAERRGIPFQVEEWRTLQAGKAGIFASMVEALPADLSPFVAEGGDWAFRFDRFERIVAGLGLAETWPRTATGQLSTAKAWQEEIVGVVPELRPLFDAMGARSRTNLLQCQVGEDGRARCPFFPFSSATGRSLPSNAKFIYGAPKLFRHVIQAPPGRTVIQLDYVAQESAIAAAFAEDGAMIAAYEAGDVHLHAAKAVGLVPEGATKGTHKAERDRIKAVNLGVVYGAREGRIAAQLRIPLAEARHLLETHRRIFPKLWRWIERAVSSAEVSRLSVTQDFWRKTVPAPFSPTVAANLPVQATGQSVLREAVVDAGAAGLPVIATVHDAIVLEAEERDAREVARAAERIMVAAAAVFCPGVKMRVDVSTTTDLTEPLADPELRPRYDQVLQRAAAAARRQGGGA